MYINDLSNNIWKVNFFADETFLCGTVHVNQWPQQESQEKADLWKIKLIIGLNKKAQEIMSSIKFSRPNHPEIHFNNAVVSCAHFQRHEIY